MVHIVLMIHFFRSIITTHKIWNWKDDAITCLNIHYINLLTLFALVSVSNKKKPDTPDATVGYNSAHHTHIPVYETAINIFPIIPQATRSHLTVNINKLSIIISFVHDNILTQTFIIIFLNLIDSYQMLNQVFILFELLF